MALFDIRRFKGDDIDEIPEDQPNIILQKLKENVRKRKSEKLNKLIVKDGLAIEVNGKVLKKVKRKKDLDHTQESHVKSKKHKKYKEIVEKESKSPIPDVDDTINLKTISKKKKKKLKESGHVDSSKSVIKNKNVNITNDKSKKGESVELCEVDDHFSATNEDCSIKEVNNDEPSEYERENVSKTVIKEGPHTVGNFTVLGDYKVKKQVKVKHILPDWLEEPGIISNSLTQTPVEQFVGLLDETLINKLQENNITHFFPVQTQILPLLLNQITDNNCYGKDGYQPSDICVSAPTGSGKTLAFALPVIQTLLNRVVCRVRALIVLPVRDLALQVYKVFQTYCKGTGLRVILLAGQTSLAEEQESLVIERLNGCCSLADIVVATPGRLVDHINKTAGFDLSHLRFLVIDEADRMMEDIKQDWLTQVENSVLKLHGSGWNLVDRRPPIPLTVHNCSTIRIAFQKLLFSATLSQDPEKLQQLNLFQPQLFTTILESKSKATENLNGTENTESQEERGDFVGKYTTPASLQERHIECQAFQKPLMVLHCIHNLNYRQILCFTNSVESTHRLFLLIKLCGGIKVREFSSALTGTVRQKILNDFASGDINMTICSDAMARGMDINNVEYVILYDRPSHIQTYIHRVGRTARAGKPGTAVTILEQREVCTYKTMLKEAGKERFKKLKIKPNKLISLKPMYDEALEKLPAIIKAEKQGKKEDY
ncbi:hypothetical protein SNE40_003108 [Patella caerulea]|uniref:ATP-dependent RNA helicase n=1 Tax=Patella caerulea TaxID=87958 RepID=A0AAN8KAA4_PATCE